MPRSGRGRGAAHRAPSPAVQLPVAEDPPIRTPAPVADLLIADLLRRGEAVDVTLFGTSMMPLSWPGVRVRITPCRMEDVGPGDLVAVARRGKLSVHRAIGRSPAAAVSQGAGSDDGTVGPAAARRPAVGSPMLRLRGDALAAEDVPATADQVLGRVEHLVVGRLRIWLPDRVGRRARRSILPLLPAIRLAYRSGVRAARTLGLRDVLRPFLHVTDGPNAVSTRRDPPSR